jgi:hypothetical protein
LGSLALRASSRNLSRQIAQLVIKRSDFWQRAQPLVADVSPHESLMRFGPVKERSAHLDEPCPRASVGHHLNDLSQVAPMPWITEADDDRQVSDLASARDAPVCVIDAVDGSAIGAGLYSFKSHDSIAP